MLGVSRKTTAFYMFTRLLGFFPYTWRVENYADSMEAPKIDKKLRLKISIPWRIWSFFITVFLVIAMILDIYWSITKRNIQDFASDTLEIVQILHYVFTSITVILIQTICWNQHGMLKKYIIKLSLYEDSDILWKKSSMSFYTMMICFVVPLNCYVYSQNLGHDEYPPVIFTMLCKFASSVVLTLFIGFTYESNMDHVARTLESNFSEIRSVLENEENDESTHTNLAIGSNKVSICAKPIKENKVTYYIDVEDHLSSNLKNCEFIRRNSISQTEKFDDLQKFIVHVFDLQKMVNEYMGKPLLFVMSSFVVCLLTTAFFLASWSILPIEMRAISFVNLAETSMSLGYITNSTNYLSETVSIIVICIRGRDSDNLIGDKRQIDNWRYIYGDARLIKFKIPMLSITISIIKF